MELMEIYDRTDCFSGLFPASLGIMHSSTGITILLWILGWLFTP